MPARRSRGQVSPLRSPDLTPDVTPAFRPTFGVHQVCHYCEGKTTIGGRSCAVCNGTGYTSIKKGQR